MYGIFYEDQKHNSEDVKWKDEEAHVFAGGGIVSESHPQKEWDETELKLQPILSALSGGQI